MKSVIVWAVVDIGTEWNLKIKPISIQLYINIR